MSVCGICGGTAPVRVYDRAVDYVTGDGFEVWRCGVCGSGWTAPVPEDLGKYYPVRYRKYKPAVAKVLEVFYARRVRGWSRMFKAPGAVFEMGCGNGLMLHMFSGLGWRAVGSERTEEAARVAREAYGVDVRVGEVAGVFDLVLLFQVLEHVAEPGPVLAGLVKMLAPDGKLVIGVPNFGSWQARFGGSGWFHLDVPRHLRHYTLQALAVVLAGQGLEIERVSYVSPEHDPFGWVQSALNRVDGKPNRLTRFLMGIDQADFWNVAQVAAACVLGVAAVPLAVVSWAAGRGAVMEVVCRRK